MPAYVYKFTVTDRPRQAEFNDWVEPQEAKLSSLAIGPDLGKLVMVYCQPDDSYTDVYEWNIGYEAAIDINVAKRFKEYVDRMTSASHRARIFDETPAHVTEIGTSPELVAGIIIGHSTDRQLPQVAPLVVPVRHMTPNLN